MKVEEKQKQLTMMVAIKKDLHHEYKVYCANKGLKLNLLINSVLDIWIKSEVGK